jgi:hypothetical protein
LASRGESTADAPSGSSASGHLVELVSSLASPSPLSNQPTKRKGAPVSGVGAKRSRAETQQRTERREAVRQALLRAGRGPAADERMPVTDASSLPPGSVRRRVAMRQHRILCELRAAAGADSDEQTAAPPPVAGEHRACAATVAATGTQTSLSRRRVRAVYDWNGGQEGDLDLSRGDVVCVSETLLGSGWCSGVLDDRSGIFPVNHVREQTLGYQSSIVEYACFDVVVNAAVNSADKRR